MFFNYEKIINIMHNLFFYKHFYLKYCLDLDFFIFEIFFYHLYFLKYLKKSVNRVHRTIIFFFIKISF